MTNPQAKPTMLAVSQDELGEAGVLKMIETARPVPGATEILVRVHAAGVNPVDWKRRRYGYDGLPAFILGWDVSGTVEAVGPGVTIFKPGDEVFGMPKFPGMANAYAEFVTAPARQFARKPASLTHVEAAGLPLAGLTAWQSLVDTASVRAGQRVLIHGAAGGVGHFAVQIAKARGAYVIATARAPKHDFVRNLGADEVIDYTTADWSEAVREIDVVFDTIAGEYGPRSLRTLRPGGLLIQIPGPVDPALDRAATAHGLRAVFVLVEPDGAGVAALGALADEGLLRVHVDTAVPIVEVAKAHEIGETNRTMGKIVLVVHP